MSNATGKLNGLTALVTGGGTGIGKGIALKFASEGAFVAVSGRRREKLDEVVNAIKSAGGRAVAVTGDVSNEAGCAKLIADAVAALGGLNILVNNAGIFSMSPLENQPAADIAGMLDTNILGPMLLTRSAIPHLTKHNHAGKAAILNIASSVVNMSIPNMAVYAATKAAIVHFTRSMAKELAGRRVRVNCINPGVVETPIFGPAETAAAALKTYAEITALGRVGQPVDIAVPALSLCSPESEWTTGAILTIDGGISLG